MKILTFSTLYPDSTRPGHGKFVETRLRYLLESGEVKSKVIAPVPWFPSKNRIYGEYAKYAAVPAKESWNNIDVFHPRYPLIPKIGMTLAPLLMAYFVKQEIRKLINNGYDFDIIDAHYFYPDGVAAVMLGQIFKKPVVITARGTDLNLIPEYKLPRKMIKWAAENSAAMITVCQALKDVLLELGVNGEKVSVLRNGVNLELFSPVENRDALREKLGIHGNTLLSVGYLITRKGHDLVIKALTQLPDVNLLIAGDGPEKDNLLNDAMKYGVADQVTFLGAVNQATLREYYCAADALVLASSREGWANVLLESMACGTPVVATRVWGTPEVVAAPEAGVLIEERTGPGIANSVKKLFSQYPKRNLTRKYAEKFSWDDTTRGQIDVFSNVLAK